MSRIQFGGGSSGGAGGSSSGLSTSLVQRAGAGFRAAIARGYHSTCIMAMGDSTGDEADEWFGKLGDLLAAKYPTHSVVWKPWNTTSQYYDAPVAVSAGTLNSGGERCVDLAASTTLRYPLTNTTISDVEISIKFLPAAGWAPGGAAASRTIASRYNASGSSRCWIFAIDETGLLKFTWSAAGTSDTGTKTSTASVTASPHSFVVGTARHVRVYFDVDNGSSGNDAKFYTSADGNTWTQLGTTVTDSGTTTLSASAYDYQLGAYNGTATGFGPGKYYSVGIRGGTPSVATPQVPVLPEFWNPSTGTQTPTGAPRITMLSGSASGQNIAYFSDGTRINRLTEQHGQQLVLFSDGHNEANDSGQTWRTTYNTFLTTLKSKTIGAAVVCLAQNPTLANVDAFKGSELRGQQIISIADSQGAYGLDIWPQFATDQTILATQLEDNIHPGPTGSAIWANYVMSQLAL